MNGQLPLSFNLPPSLNKTDKTMYARVLMV